jgi:Helicase conserved C-terminal domain
VRIVIDECHQVLTDRDQRFQFDKIRQLAQYKVQKIYLTATLPPILVKPFLRRVGLPASTSVVRALTNRPNIRYHLLRVNEHVRRATAVAVDVANVLESQFTSGLSRGIIFVDSIEDANTIGRSFNNFVCHGKMDPIVRTQNQSNWFGTSGNQKWIVATTGFIHGIDHPRVEGVVVCGLLYGLINLAQAFGRAGRLGQPVSVVEVNNGLMNLIHAPHESDDASGRAAVNRWIANATYCRRESLSAYLDGCRVNCGELNAESCDICDPDTELLRLLRPLVSHPPEHLLPPNRLPLHPPLTTSIPRPRQSTVTTSHNIVRLPPPGPSIGVQLDASIWDSNMASKADKANMLCKIYFRLYGKCVICWAWKERIVEQDKNHIPLVSCRNRDKDKVPWSSGWNEFRKLIRFDGKFEYCYHCGVPQGDYKPTRHPGFHQHETVACPTNSFVYLVIWYLFHEVKIMDKARRAFPALKDCSNISQFADWVMKEEAGNFYNGLELFIWFWKTRGLDSQF